MKIVWSTSWHSRNGSCYSANIYIELLQWTDHQVLRIQRSKAPVLLLPQSEEVRAELGDIRWEEHWREPQVHTVLFAQHFLLIN